MSYSMNNRILMAIERQKQAIEQKVAAGLVTKEKVAQTAKNLNMDAGEHAMFQERKSLAFASGKLTQDEAQTVYNLLGESVEVFNNQPVEVKAVLTKMFAELLGV